MSLANAKPGLIVHSEKPLNAEPPLDRLCRSFQTDVRDFYTRSHGDIPELDADTHEIEVNGEVKAPKQLSRAELMARFEPRNVIAAMQCAGNRRADLQPVRPTSGDPWAPGAIGNAEWTGVALVDVLRAAGANLSTKLHVAFEAIDIAENEDAPDAPYGVSIPMSKALCEDVLIAWEMNGAPLTREHGAPLRLVVPGFAGVRSVKWLRSITVQSSPSHAFQQAKDYLLFPPGMRKETRDLSKGVTIEAMPLNSAICDPSHGATFPSGRVAVRGYAIATDRPVVRVDVSPNGGRDWVQAELEDHGVHRWSWTLWRATLDLAKGEHELAVRAWDAAGQTQPAEACDVWNFKGYLCAAWHRVRIRVQ